jgi:hypothetical protein
MNLTQTTNPPIINTIEDIINILNNIPNLKHVTKHKYFHEPAYTTIKIKVLKNMPKNMLCQITIDYGIAGSPMYNIPIYKNLSSSKLIDAVGWAIKNSCW